MTHFKISVYELLIEVIFMEDTLARHEQILDEHEHRISELEGDNKAVAVQIQTLCDKLSSQTKAIYTLVTLCAGELIGFFFYVIKGLI